MSLTLDTENVEKCFQPKIWLCVENWKRKSGSSSRVKESLMVVPSPTLLQHISFLLCLYKLSPTGALNKGGHSPKLDSSPFLQNYALVQKKNYCVVQFANCCQLYTISKLRPQTCQDAKTLWNFKASAILTSDKVHHHLKTSSSTNGRCWWQGDHIKRSPGQYTDGSTICYYESNIQ